MDIDWCLAELRKMGQAISYTTQSGIGGLYYTLHANPQEIHALAQVVDKILDRAVPEWRKTMPADPTTGKPPWKHHRAWISRAIAELERAQELEDHLGHHAPRLSMEGLHPWVWDSASVPWSAGSYADAIRAAARGVNAKARQKLGRKNLSEWKLLTSAFDIKPALEGEPRLRLMPADGSDTFVSLHQGAAALARGMFQAVRNPANHEEEDELEEQYAVECLAGFSLLARFVADAEVERFEA